MRALLASAVALLSACSSTPAANQCTSDAECPLAGTRCDLTLKQCVCKSDEACKDGEFCNGAGVCQVKAGCVENVDCAGEPDTFCDLDTGKCLLGPATRPASACGLATHCAPGSICVAASCAPGCFDDGDCALGDVCTDGACRSGEGLCSSDAFCDYRERCVEDQCKLDRRGPYCRGCTQPTFLNPTPCDEPRNFCLVNNQETMGHREYCGVDCSLGQPCPQGYDCSNVAIPTRDTCQSTASCQCSVTPTLGTKTCTVAVACDPRKPNGDPDPSAGSCVYEAQPDCNGGAPGPATCLVPRGSRRGSCGCATDADCAAGAKCAAGFCCAGQVTPDRECVGFEGAVSGLCTCATDDDCPHDSCDVSRGFCAISGKPCTVGGNECGAIACVNGGCLIGQNCAPLEGLSCSVVGGR